MDTLIVNPQVFWLIARATGLVAWAVLSASVLLGLALSTRALGRRPTPAWLQDLHRGAGGLSIAFTVLHLAALVADSYVHVDLADLLVPMASEWRPVPVAAGVVALWLLLAVEGTSLARRRIGPKWWRRIHATSAVLWVLATAHLLAAGTDAGDPWVAGTVVATTMAVAILGLVRLLRPRPRRTRRGADRRAKRSTPPVVPVAADQTSRA